MRQNARNGRSVSGKAAWRAVLKRDRSYDGKFVYAATSTGIYCRPSCPARSPQRRNTVLFGTAGDAEREGYVACLRCFPRFALTPAEVSIKAALQYIGAHLDQVITLKTLSRISGLSPHHFREAFKRIVGLSPRAFCDMCRIARFKQLLQAGESVSSACYHAGFGSSRALYEKSRRGMGMTPAVYRRGGKGAQIRCRIYRSSFGPALVARTRLGICSIRFGREARALIRELRKEFARASVEKQPRFERKHPVFSNLGEDPLIARLPASIRERVLQAKLLAILE